MHKKLITVSPLLLILLVSCSGIKTKNKYQSTKLNETPTTTIKKFTYETHQRKLDEVIKHGAVKNKQEGLFLRSGDKELVNKWIKYFTTNGKKTYEIFMTNGAKYKPAIEAIFEQHNLPKELFYVGLIESGYKFRARSHAGAVGYWQFIKGTATRYGMKVNNHIDERQNIIKSTQAAALYFQDLYNIFGSWELALSAYNAGEYGVIRRIRGAKTRDYYELSEKKILPKETRNYIPKVLAAIYVSKNLRKYNIVVPKVSSSIYDNAKPYTIKSAANLSQISKDLKVSTSVLKMLNRDIKGDYIPYAGKDGHDIILPARKNYNFAAIKELRAAKTVAAVKTYTNAQTHIVRKNESLYSISKRYNIKIATLKSYNKLSRSTIFVGQKIKLPIEQKANVKYSYIVKKGDHLSRIARIFNTNTGHIKNLNKLSHSRIFVGQKLKVPAHKKQHYTVKKGDNLIRIANNFRSSTDIIKELNKIGNHIYPGQKLVVKIENI